jgi:hypothetical protein
MPIPELPPEATKTKIFQHMNTGALLSLGQLCDAKCEVYMNKKECNIYYKKKKILQGKRDTKTGMWLIHNYDTTVQPQFTPQLNSAYSIRVKKDLVQYLHAAAFCPAPKSWIAAIKRGFFSTWPGLTEKLVRKHLQKSGATIRGRQTRVRQNIRSTQKLEEDLDNPEVFQDKFPEQMESKNIISLAITDPR